MVGVGCVYRAVMSALGQKLPRRGRRAISALPPRAAADVVGWRSRLGPIGDKVRRRKNCVLFDHVVSASQKGRRDVDGRFGGEGAGSTGRRCDHRDMTLDSIVEDYRNLS